MLLLFQSYLVYLVLLLGALVLSVYWRRRQRKTKLPFDPKIERVRRTAGEGARRKIDELSEKIESDALAAFFAPIAVVDLWNWTVLPTFLWRDRRRP